MRATAAYLHLARKHMATYWEDLSIGDTFTSERNLTINSEDIIEFASKYDPQPYHLDPSAAETSIFGGLCASGWQISALTLRIISDCFRSEEIAMMGLASVEELRWEKAVFAGDALSVKVNLIEKIATSRLPKIGTIIAEAWVKNQKNESVAILPNSLLISMKKDNHER